MRVEACRIEDAGLTAGDNLDRPIAFEEPAHKVNVVSKDIDDRRCVRRAFQN